MYCMLPEGVYEPSPDNMQKQRHCSVESEAGLRKVADGRRAGLVHVDTPTYACFQPADQGLEAEG